MGWMSQLIMLTSSLTFARAKGLVIGGKRVSFSGKCSSENSIMAMDCVIMVSCPSLLVKMRVGTLAEGFWWVYDSEF